MYLCPQQKGKNVNIGFIGIGKLGLPCAETIARKNHNVAGYDIVSKASETIDIQDNIKSTVMNKDIVFIAVPTPHDEAYGGDSPCSDLPPKDFDYSIVKDSIIEANKYMNDTQLLVLISTVLPGTTRRELINLVTNTRFVYNPYLIAMGSVAWDMVNPEMVMIGTADGSTNGDAKELIEFYNTIMENNPRYVVGTWDECECIKVFYNTFISAKIGLVNMIQDVAEKQKNINVDIVTDALAKSSLRIMSPQYMTAGMGDGGACHPRDNIALRYLSDQLNLKYDLFGSVMKSREVQAKNLAETLVYHAKTNKYPIVIHGKAYKPNVPYTDGSYSLLVGHYCEELGIEPHYVDPETGDEWTGNTPAVFLLAHNPTVTYKYMDNTKNNTKLYCEILPNSVVVDPWRSFEMDHVKVIPYGNTRIIK